MNYNSLTSMAINKTTIVLSVLLAALSCGSRLDDITHRLLIRSSAKQIYSADQVEKLSARQMNDIMSSDFRRGVDTIKYLKHRIYVSCLKSAPGCAQYGADIVIKGDTIEVNLVNK